MSLIDIKNLTFTHIGSLKPIFDHVDLQLDTNWKLGFIGRNGYGKSTFLKLLMGKFPYKGSIHSSVNFEYFPYVVENPKDMTITVIQTLKGEFPLWKLQKEMNLLELKEEVLYRPFSTLSHGEQTKILLATMFIAENQFLLIDEPTNHLDVHGRKLVAEYFAKKKGFIVVSHDREFLNVSIDHVLAIEKNKIVLTKGNYDTWQHNKHLEDKFELEQNEKLRKEIRRLKESAREKATWSDKVEKTKIGQGPVDRGYIGHMSAKMMKRSKNMEKRYEVAIEKKHKLLKNIEEIDPLQVVSLEHHADTLIETENFTLYYDGIQTLEPVSFTVNQGECLVLQGNNGSGKSSIIKAILGEKLQTSGHLWKAKNLIISYVPQHFNFLKGNLFEFISECNIDKTQFLTIFRKMGIQREQFDIPMECYSSGQKKKVLLAKSLCEQAHVYIWDEPLNYIDIISRIQIENMILEYAPTMILVEHDKKFIDKVATDIVELH
ncbi:ribosomal protection-like ABC-F family protein [Anaerosalibacter massiliensis]|uniref:ABC-F type ribosomal protection protein n=1 Tax=Anaerosalibacter massiliensis TaxID=1347392 RepID=A0A9X2MKP4_9FIRM|nr:ABC-F type ribosomal protection protein [Anaerosalibacter massiliensis]MCR2043026.1 ABC-F type ribosomal protection protein [Anaerosalibacter massiliensis]